MIQVVRMISTALRMIITEYKSMKITTEAEHASALARIDELWKKTYPEACTPEYIEIQGLVEAVVEYEEEHYPIAEPDEDKDVDL